jgi:hypothetical protein
MLVVVAVRIRFLDLPLERDEGEYAYGAQLLPARRSSLPRPLHAEAARRPRRLRPGALVLFGQTKVAIRLGLLAVSLATAWLLYLVGRRLSGRLGLSAAALYLVAASSLSVLACSRTPRSSSSFPRRACWRSWRRGRRRAQPPWLPLAGALSAWP